MSLISCADFAVEGETFGEEMYDAVGTSFDGGAEVNEENASDSPIENKFSPSVIPRYMSERSTNFNHRILVFSDNTRYRIVVVGDVGGVL